MKRSVEVDAGAARRMPGALLVLTGAEVEKLGDLPAGQQGLHPQSACAEMRASRASSA